MDFVYFASNALLHCIDQIDATLHVDDISHRTTIHVYCGLYDDLLSQHYYDAWDSYHQSGLSGCSTILPVQLCWISRASRKSRSLSLQILSTASV